MKKYIYGTILIAGIAAAAVFFFRPPETANPPPQRILSITFRLPEGYGFTEGAPFLLTWQAEVPITSARSRGLDAPSSQADGSITSARSRGSEAPSSQAEDPQGKLSEPVPVKNFDPLTAPFQLVFSPSPDSAAVVLNARLYYCHKPSGMCFQDDFKARVPLMTGDVSPVTYVWEIAPQKNEPIANSL